MFVDSLERTFKKKMINATGVPACWGFLTKAVKSRRVGTVHSTVHRSRDLRPKSGMKLCSRDNCVMGEWTIIDLAFA